MKKSIIITVAALTTLSLAGYGFMSSNEVEMEVKHTPCIGPEGGDQPSACAQLAVEQVKYDFYSDFNYTVGPRFKPVTKHELMEATSFANFVTEDEAALILSYKSVEVVVIENEQQTTKREIGYTEQLTSAQRELLQTADYSSNFMIRAEFEGMKQMNGLPGRTFYGPHITVVPETQAQYSKGTVTFIRYLMEGNKPNTANLDESKVQPAMLYFTVAKTGRVKDVHLKQTSGYASIDEAMIKLVKDAPGHWIPAVNAQGDKVDQELAISIYLTGAGGC